MKVFGKGSSIPETPELPYMLNVFPVLTTLYLYADDPLPAFWVAPPPPYLVIYIGSFRFGRHLSKRSEHEKERREEEEKRKKEEEERRTELERMRRK